MLSNKADNRQFLPVHDEGFIDNQYPSKINYKPQNKIDPDGGWTI